MTTDLFDPDDLSNNPTVGEGQQTLGEIIQRRFSRRGFLKTAIASSLASQTGHNVLADTVDGKKPEQDSAFSFSGVSRGFSESHEITPDHVVDVLIRWGDPLFSSAPEFDPHNQTVASQEEQFGFNNDFLGFVPLTTKANQKARGLLCVNHEYTDARMMFPDFLDLYHKDKTGEQTREAVAIQQAAIGNSIVEIEYVSSKSDDEAAEHNWRIVLDSPYNRRITAGSTPIAVSGPAAGHDRLKTSADPTGKLVIGTQNNCAGGITPWGTYLTCEENFNLNFDGKLEEDHPEAVNHERYGVPSNRFGWGKYDSRFDVSVNPNEPNRFGWVVEIDPKDPNSTPKKRTALGRIKHEGAENVMAPSGQLVVYMGDDQQFDYAYKFITKEKVNLIKPEANADLLDYGTLYVAKFFDDGTLSWLPLVFGQGPLIADNGFKSQADVLIETRRAADLLGATPMDRPEDIVPNPKTGKVYVMLTNNTSRTEANAANPRVKNTFGHVIEIVEPENDFAETKSTWRILVLAGDPRNADHQALWHPETDEDGWFASPDNGVVDPLGRLWVSTDQSSKSSLSGTSDGLWSLDTSGDARGLSKMFFRCPNGAELCGPTFTPDGRSLFVSVQHPGVNDREPSKTGYHTPTTRWPDFIEDMPPRPSVVVIRRKDGGVVG